LQRPAILPVSGYFVRDSTVDCSTGTNSDLFFRIAANRTPGARTEGVKKALIGPPQRRREMRCSRPLDVRFRSMRHQVRDCSESPVSALSYLILANVDGSFRPIADLRDWRSEGPQSALTAECCTCTWSLLSALSCRSRHRPTPQCGFRIADIHAPRGNLTALSSASVFSCCRRN
jgi:hypothetical protein